MENDRSIATGVINPGGSATALSRDAIFERDDATPGLALKFNKPIVNGVGPDVIFFDLQSRMEAPYSHDLKQIAINRFPDDIQTMVRKPDADQTPYERQMAYLVMRQVGAECNSVESQLKPDEKDRVLELKRALETHASKPSGRLPSRSECVRLVVPHHRLRCLNAPTNRSSPGYQALSIHRLRRSFQQRVRWRQPDVARH